MALLTITVNDPGLPSKHAEVAYARRVVDEAMKEFCRGNGTVTSGNIVSTSTAGAANVSLGNWAYVPSASLP